MNRSSFLFPLLLLFAAACSSATAPEKSPSPRPTLTPTLTPVLIDTPIPPSTALAVSYFVSTEGHRKEVLAGLTVHVYAEFELEACQDLDGLYRECVSQQDGALDGVQMRLCVAPDEPCPLDGEWVPFDRRPSFPVEVDWIGSRDLWLVAEFRDAGGERLPTIRDFYYESEPEPLVAKPVTIEGILDDRTPVFELPPPVQTQVAPTRLALPVLGAVEIAGGSSAMGGPVGITIEIPVAFEATSPFAEVTEMRSGTVASCLRVENIYDMPWEPLASEKIFSYPITVQNWVGFYVAVQYRDALGNLSRVLCDDISVEGMPATLTPTP